MIEGRAGVGVYLLLYVRAHLAIPCVSANDNTKHIKTNFKCVFYKKTNKMKKMWKI